MNTSDLFHRYGDSLSNKQSQPEDGSTLGDLFSNYPTVVGGSNSGNSVEARGSSEIPESEKSSNTIPTANPQPDKQSLEALFSELDSLTGLRNVKNEVRRLIQFVRVQDMRRQEGFGSSDITMHSVFYGSPGTGKTTVARIYGKMLKALGLLSTGHLVETDRAGLVGNYVGQTANKTDEKIAEAIGGVLFIDEAYSLHKGDDAKWDYGSEAIEVLLKRMEDYRQNLAVIVAGYPKPMNDFLNSNEGFKSRFSTFVHFEDYSPDELLSIFTGICASENYLLSEGTLQRVSLAIKNEHAHRDETFGNARYVRNLFQQIARNQALRIGETLSQPTKTDLLTLMPEDVPLPKLQSRNETRAIGFDIRRS